MKLFTSISTLAIAILVSLPLRAQLVTHSFDTVTAIDLDHAEPSVAGIEKDTGDDLTVTFIDRTNINYRYVVNRCVPLFLTALEKPGRYYLHITVDPSESFVQLQSCRLELKHKH